jgi:hypothetical protein
VGFDVDGREVDGIREWDFYWEGLVVGVAMGMLVVMLMLSLSLKFLLSLDFRLLPLFLLMQIVL